MTKFKEELENLVDKYKMNPPQPSDEMVSLVQNVVKHFGGGEQAVCMCLISLGNLTKHLAVLCNKNDMELEFAEIMADPVIKVTSTFASQILSVKKFK